MSCYWLGGIFTQLLWFIYQNLAGLVKLKWTKTVKSWAFVEQLVKHVSHISVCCIIIRFHIITFYFNLTRCRIFVYWLSTDTIIHVPYSVPRFCFHHFLLNVSIIMNIFVPKLCSSSRMKKKYRLSVLIHPLYCFRFQYTIKKYKALQKTWKVPAW